MQQSPNAAPRPLPDWLRAGAYVLVLVALVVFAPGATKQFIYFQF